MVLTTQQIIDVAKISTYLSADAVSKGALYGSQLDPKLPRLLYMELKALEWGYNQSSTYTSIQDVANYVLSLCYKRNQAVSILNGGSGGTVAPIVPLSAPSPLSFVVADDTFIVDGQSTKIFPVEWQGYEMVFNRNNVPQSRTNLNDGSAYYSWSKTIRVFTCFPAATDIATDLFDITPTI